MRFGRLCFFKFCFCERVLDRLMVVAILNDHHRLTMIQKIQQGRTSPTSAHRASEGPARALVEPEIPPLTSECVSLYGEVTQVIETHTQSSHLFSGNSESV